MGNQYKYRQPQNIVKNRKMYSDENDEKIVEAVQK